MVMMECHSRRIVGAFQDLAKGRLSRTHDVEMLDSTNSKATFKMMSHGLLSKLANGMADEKNKETQ
jgi:hypothetical protein